MKTWREVAHELESIIISLSGEFSHSKEHRRALSRAEMLMQDGNEYKVWQAKAHMDAAATPDDDETLD